MSSGEDQDVRAASSSSSSESDSEEETVATTNGEAAGDTATALDTLTRSVQVLSAAPRPPRRDDSGGENGREGDGTSSVSSSSETEDNEEEAEGPTRGKSYLQSIRARKPKKKVYAKPKGKRKIVISVNLVQYICALLQ